VKREKPRVAGASGKAPLLGKRNPDTSGLSRVEKHRTVMDEVLRVCPMSNSASRTGGDHSQGVLGSADFQTCRMADSPKSAGREAAPRGGFGNLCCGAQAAQSNSQLEFVISRFLPSINFAREF
jgi:hypothetical protein